MRASSALASCAVVLAGACDWMPGRPSEADKPVRPNEVLSFDVLYEQFCEACHGADGTLGAARSLNDALYLALVDDAELTEVIRHGRAGTLMPGFVATAGRGLTDEQIDSLVAGMRERWGGAPRLAGVGLPSYERPTDVIGDAVRGEAAYQTFCMGCHGVDGSGAEEGGSVVDASYLALVSDQALRVAVIAGRTDLGMPDWRDYVSGRSMTEQEIADVVAWLASHREEFPVAEPAETQLGE